MSLTSRSTFAQKIALGCLFLRNSPQISLLKMVGRKEAAWFLLWAADGTEVPVEVDEVCHERHNM